MARQEKRLSALAVTKATKPGMHADGLGLYLRIGPTGAKSWVFRYRVGKSRRDMGLGPLHTVSLAEARVKAAECRKLRLDNSDPLHVREAALLATKLESAKTMTFQDCAEAYVAAHSSSWRNAKHADQWRNTLSSYAYPVFGQLAVQRSCPAPWCSNVAAEQGWLLVQAARGGRLTARSSLSGAIVSSVI